MTGPALLLDENLAASLVQRLADVFPGSTHVRLAGLTSATDMEVWSFAKRERLMIVSKDADFRQMSLVFGAPPKYLAILIGNCPTSTVESLLRRNHRLITEFANDSESTLLELPTLEL